MKTLLGLIGFIVLMIVLACISKVVAFMIFLLALALFINHFNKKINGK